MWNDCVYVYVCVAVEVKELNWPKLCVNKKKKKANGKGIFRYGKNMTVVGCVCVCLSVRCKYVQMGMCVCQSVQVCVFRMLASINRGSSQVQARALHGTVRVWNFSYN